jgi:5'-nucleotidase (lipoprotein e(P4) family)
MKRIFGIVAIAGTLLLVSSKPAEKNQGAVASDYLIQAVLWYQSSPEMQALYLQGFNMAKMNLASFVKDRKDKPQAVVVDIDETMLDNSPFEGRLIHTGKSFKPEIWKEWSDQAKAKALPGAVDFTKLAKSLGITVIFISNRDTSEMSNTIKNLNDAGFEFASKENMFFKTNESSKDARRKQVSEKYDIVMLIGDNLSDFNTVFDTRDGSTEYARLNEMKNQFGYRYIVLPNPTYGDWEKPITKGCKSELEKYNARIAKVVGF